MTRIFDTENTTGLVIIAGNIVDGTGQTNNGINKTGNGYLLFTGSNTYTGPTTLTAGFTLISSDSTISPASQISFNGGYLADWNPTTTPITTTRSYVAPGAAQFDIGAALTFTEAPAANFSGPGQFYKERPRHHDLAGR